MTSTTPVPPLATGAGRHDGFPPVREDDAFLEQAVSEAELPALLAALALVTGDTALLEDGVKPPLPPMDSTIAPQGGMSAAAQQRARELAVGALKAFRDGGSVPAPDPGPELLGAVMRFVTKDAGDEYLPLLRHELGLAGDLGAPTWHKDDTAPATPFSVAVIGAGISGLAAAHRLQQAGVDHVVFDKNPEVGGTWWENVYPGCRLDTPNFAYSYSFAQKPDWPDQFSRRQQIEDYLRDVATDFGLRPHIRFDTEVLAASWDEAEHLWTLTTRTGDEPPATSRFHAVVSAVGQLNLPNIPDIPGRDTFAGRWFHSSRWDPAVDVTGLRVAVVGTGASAYQIVPSVVGAVAGLTVFQRNAPWMLPTPGYHRETPPGMHWLLRHVPHYGRCYRFWQFWLASEGRLPFVEADPEWTEEGSTSARNAELRRQLLGHLRAQVADRPDLLAKMTPTYPPGAKRMTRDNGVWAAALKQPHVDLVTEAVTSIVPEGIVTADGVLHEVDLVVYATGFRASDYLEPMTVTGRDGVDLHESWDGDARAHMGVTVPGFPNLFLLMGPNTGVVVNGSSLFMAECATEYVLECLGELLRRRAQSLEPTREATDAFCAWVDEGNLRRAWGVADVHTWYRNRHGRASQVWPYSLVEFHRRTRRPDLSAFTVRGGGEETS
ncbi:flavin-containing monooxygenase [Pseudonocardia abyssalis]|uniref:flavin-containing monooxygenase n=1 Tax=Pseudonocardia abyssalis TaxID=2792008 RepID=UPI001C49D32D|nr:NAD(P)/FAD-dependent oxidoreductase [Pseudonocardia abyssalis]MBW0113758.1 NAD(P)/FAD-dependent oxidoreductase [Pseudonocardia abyssalis]